ncbi:MAG: NAD(P)/FAD-dependent oxidoreductase [Eubacteriales bacterium]|nr:NAD(P)/FAD-dependent oxidoreductase [Eubacteriales bacterium]
MKKEIAVVGGGAAGMMAAYAASLGDSHVTIYEKNEKLGKKIYITGKGRCNVTNACDTESLFASVIRNPKFLYSAFYGFDNRKTMDFFEQEGCSLKTERGDRVFPVSDHASDIIRTLENVLKKRKVDICLQTEVKSVLTVKKAEADGTDHEQTTVCGLELRGGRRVKADAVILATGGLSYPATGSTGDGYRMAEELSHTVVSCSPSLVPFETAEEWCRDLQGLALKNVEVSMESGGREVYRGFGEMLFTHFGVSGPLILSASSFYKGKDCRLYLNLKPALDLEQLDKRLVRDFEANKNRNFKNALDGLFPARLIPVMIGLSGIDPEKKVHEITRQERRAFAALIRHVPVTVTGTRNFKEAIITRGGVKVQEINPSTMESKLAGGLYFAGELLDVDALTGGFNLQIAWSTGYLAGESAGGMRMEE